MPHLVAAPDKFRGTASAAEAAAAAGRAARNAGWTADEVPLSDGGEGLLEAVGGEPCHAMVAGPLGHPAIEAEWRLLAAGDDGSTTAVLEMARTAGRALLPHPRGEDPVVADTTGVGQLLLAAADAGVARIVVGCGGSATTDGGWGAVQVVGSAAALKGIAVEVACDVTTPFRQAAAVFGPQKGASPEQIERLTARLDQLAERYRDSFGVDVHALPGAGAAGGLAGGLAALGARIVPGFDLVARLTGLAGRLAAADLVMTGEGHLDPPSFAGKVPGGVLHLAGGRPVLCVVGDADASLLGTPPSGMSIVSLTRRFGATRARRDTASLITAVTAEAVTHFCS